MPPGRSSSRAVVSSPAGTRRTRHEQAEQEPPQLHAAHARRSRVAERHTSRGVFDSCRCVLDRYCWSRWPHQFCLGPGTRHPPSAATGHRENGIRVAPGRTTLLAFGVPHHGGHPPQHAPVLRRPRRPRRARRRSSPTPASPRRSRSRPPRCPTRWRAATSSAAAAPAPARPTPSCSRCSRGWPTGRGKRQPGRPRALVLAPTRELASQIEAAMAPLAKAMNLRTITIFGGVRPNPQIQGLRNGVDIVIACPGRLADHVQSGHCDLGSIEITVLDEADHMADLGFLPVVRRLLDKTPSHGQRLLFSATLDAGVDVLVKRFLHDPVTHSVDSAQSPVAQHDPPRAARQQGGPRARAGRPDRGAGQEDRVHPHQARRQGAGPPAQRARRPGRRAARQPVAERPDPEPHRLRQRHGDRRSSPPTSRPAASTSTTSASSCTPTRRSSTRPTCTARAAPPAPAPRAPSSR